MVPVVIVPGASARGIMGGNIAETLRQLGRVTYLVSLPGHGDSELRRGKPLGHHSLDDFSKGLRVFFETLGTRVDAWGHSMGGAVIQEQFSSGLIRNAVLIGSPVPRVPLLSKFEIARRAAKYWKAIVFWRKFHYGKDDYLAMLLNETPRKEAEALFGGTVPESGRAIAQVCTGCFRFPSAVRIERLLVVSSRSDLMTPAYMGRLLYRKYRRHCPTKHMLLDGDHMKIFLKGSCNEVTAIAWSFPCLA
ncbi:MAG TPA: alpha/beta fold hydrolase [Candidatus Paceibacterota bacterium]|nr:MAG: hypothetical protein UY03_C0013G0027 [Parcubacteria group bacterium GW2011_GWA2_47_64]KKU95603.1 MAG: hypothetical protein UY29_C0023G0015 [Parcubacteria group bacterium GW2011_GWC2_48_17]